MDDHLVALGRDEHDDLEQVPGAIGSDDELAIRVLADVVDDEAELDGVDDVVVIDAMAASRRVDLHTTTAYYENTEPHLAVSLDARSSDLGR